MIKETKEVAVCPKCLKPFAPGRGWADWFGIIPLGRKCRHCGFTGGPVKISTTKLRKLRKS